mgnify:FL=1
MKGTNFMIEDTLSYIGDRIEEIDRYVEDLKQIEGVSFHNNQEIEESFKDLTNVFYEYLTREDVKAIEDYMMLGFKSINSILRGVWDYNKNGVLSEDIKSDAYKRSDLLHHVLVKAPTIPFPMKVYRGVDISAFYSYGLTSLEDLKYLQDKYFLELGFCSSSLLRDSSFFVKNPEWGSKPNIEIEILIPDGCDDGVLVSDFLNHEQQEFLIQDSSLFKVTDVEIEKDKAYLKMTLIPQKIWNFLDYEQEKREIKGR